MKLPWLSMLLTLGLYIAVVVGFFVADQLAYRRGANDMDKSLLTAAVLAVLLLFFALRSLYKAIWVDTSYWWVVVVHGVCLAVLAKFLMS